MVDIATLRIFTMIMRIIEIDEEKRLNNIQLAKPFLPEPIMIIPLEITKNYNDRFDKNGNPFPIPKSKYHN